MSLLDDAIEKAELALGTLKQAREEIAALETAGPAKTADAAAIAEEQALPFKCPACGANYELQVVCANQHAPEQTLPTEEVLAGAAPTGIVDAAAGTAATDTSSSSSTTEPAAS